MSTHDYAYRCHQPYLHCREREREREREKTHTDAKTQTQTHNTDPHTVVPALTDLITQHTN